MLNWNLCFASLMDWRLVGSLGTKEEMSLGVRSPSLSASITGVGARPFPVWGRKHAFQVSKADSWLGPNSPWGNTVLLLCHLPLQEAPAVNPKPMTYPILQPFLVLEPNQEQEGGPGVQCALAQHLLTVSWASSPSMLWSHTSAPLVG